MGLLIKLAAEKNDLTEALKKMDPRIICIKNPSYDNFLPFFWII